MNGKKLIGMAIAFVVLASIALMQQRGGKHRSAAAGKDQTLLAGFDLNTVTGLDVTQGTNSVALAKKDGHWVVGKLSGYPVDFKKLVNAVRAMAEVELGEPVRTGNVDASEFGFGTNETKVVLKVGDSVAATVEVGARREPSAEAGWANQHFVRKAGDESVYLVDYDFRPFSATPADWIDKQVLNVRSSDVVSVKVGDVELKLDGADWKLADLDSEKEGFQSSEANKLRSALQYLYFETVADKAKSDAELGFTNAVEYVAQTKDGFTYTATLGGETPDGGRYARFAVAYAKPAAPSAPADDAAQEKKDAYQKQLDAFNATCGANEKKASELNAKLAGWTYALGSAKAGDFLIPRSKLVKEKEQSVEKDGEKLETE